MRTILFTGATGFLGSELLRRQLLWDSTSEIILLARGELLATGGRASAELRVRKLLAELVDPAMSPESSAELLNRVRVFDAVLSAPRLGLPVFEYERLAGSVTDIVHFAADVRFHLELEEARQANVEPVLQLLRLAAQATRAGVFRRFHQISTYAVARPGRDGVVRETLPPEDTDFRNTYERTKAEAEWHLGRAASEVPVSIYRTSIVGGDSRTGWTLRFNSFYQVIRLFLNEVARQVREIPVDGRTRLDLVTIDSVADALFWLASDRRTRPQSGEVLNVTAGAAAPAMVSTLQSGFEILRRKLGERGLAIPEPLNFMALEKGPDGERLLAEALDRACGGRRTLLRMFHRYSPYFTDSAQYDNQALLSALKPAGIRPKVIHEHLEPILDYCLRTEWGDHPELRPSLGPAPEWANPMEPQREYRI